MPRVLPNDAHLREAPNGVKQIEEVDDLSDELGKDDPIEGNTIAVKVAERAPAILALRVRVLRCAIEPGDAFQRQHAPDSRHNLIIPLFHVP